MLRFLGLRALLTGLIAVVSGLTGGVVVDLIVDYGNAKPSTLTYIVGALIPTVTSVVSFMMVIVQVANRPFRSRSVGGGLLRAWAGLLPGAAAVRYREEWAGELYDLRAEGARWWRRAGYMVGVVLWAAPVLAVTLRLRPRWATD